MDEGYDVMPWTRTIDVNSDTQIIPTFPDLSPLELSIIDSSWWESISGSWVFNEGALLTNSSFYTVIAILWLNCGHWYLPGLM